VLHDKRTDVILDTLNLMNAKLDQVLLDGSPRDKPVRGSDEKTQQRKKSEFKNKRRCSPFFSFKA